MRPSTSASQARGLMSLSLAVAIRVYVAGAFGYISDWHPFAVRGKLAPMTIFAAAGRRIDAADASRRRFPLANREVVRDRLRAALLAHKATGIVASGACGADLLLQDVGRELKLPCRRMILPFAADVFHNSSVIDRPGDWGPLFDDLVAELGARGDVVTLAEDPGGDAAYAAVNKAILAEAERIAGGSVPIALLIWDGVSRGDDDLTADLAIKARARNWPVVEVLTV
jgi:hypothetical protein